MPLATLRAAHGLRPMSGRDPQEQGRVATPLELLFDLTFVVAFANAGNQMAQMVAAGHWAMGATGFVFVIFGITWAWINYACRDPRHRPSRLGRAGRREHLPRDLPRGGGGAEPGGNVRAVPRRDPHEWHSLARPSHRRALLAAAFVFASMGLTFGMWWIYFVVPFGEILHHRPDRGFVFGYGHIVVFGAIAAVGAGLHEMAYYLEAHHDPEAFGWVHISQAGAVLAVALPVMLFFTFLIAIWRYLFRSNDRLHTVEVLLTVATLIGAVALAAAHVSLTVCLLVIALAPAIVVVGYEVAGGHEKQAAALEAESSGSHH